MVEEFFGKTLFLEKQAISKQAVSEQEVSEQGVSDDTPELSPLALAYVGDSIYDFRVRDYLCRRYQVNLNRVNSRKTKLVCAKAQSDLMGFLMEEKLLTEEELSLYRRATGFEALLGYLYYAGKISRLIRLVEQGLEHLLAQEETKA